MNRNNTRKLIVRLFVFVVSLVLIGADLVLSSAQNSNSSTTTQEDSAMQNSNTSGANMNRAGRRRRRRRRASTEAMPPNACMPSDANTTMQENANAAGAGQENANMGGEATGNANMGGRRRGRRRGRVTATMTERGTAVVVGPGQELVTDRLIRTGRCDPMAQEQTDLSGTYTGRVGYTDATMSGDGTLTINGNDFTLTSGSVTQEGRIVAVTTCNYTAVTMRFGKDQTVTPGQTPPPPLPTISLRARRTGGGLSLETVPGESHMFSFHSTGASGGGMRRGRRGMRRRGRHNAPPADSATPPPST